MDVHKQEWTEMMRTILDKPRYRTRSGVVRVAIGEGALWSGRRRYRFTCSAFAGSLAE